MEADYQAKREAAKKNGDLELEDGGQSLEDKVQSLIGRANAVDPKLAAA